MFCPDPIVYQNSRGRRVLVRGIAISDERERDHHQNGTLLSVANEAGFEAFVTIDKQLEYQQNLAALALPVVIVDGNSNTLPALLPFEPFLHNLFASSLDLALYIVQESGNVLQLKEPRIR